MSKKKPSLAQEARQRASDAIYNDILNAINSASLAAKFSTTKSIPANIPDSIHSLIIKQFELQGFKVEVTDSNDHSDEITISWE